MAQNLIDILQIYERFSGQCVNFEKFTVVFNFNTSRNDKDSVSSLLGLRCASNVEKYLGLPNLVKRRKKAAFQSMKDRVRIKIDGWGMRWLSQGGREVFVKSVLQAIPTYSMMCFLLPNSLCKEMEGIIAKFRKKSMVNGEFIDMDGTRCAN